MGLLEVVEEFRERLGLGEVLIGDALLWRGSSIQRNVGCQFSSG